MENTNKALVNKWEPILEGIEDQYVRESTSVLLENQARSILTDASKDSLLTEDTTVGTLGTFQKFAFPLVRRVYPELLANKICGVQPMQGPVSQVFYLGHNRAHGGTVETIYSKYNLTYKGSGPGIGGQDADGSLEGEFNSDGISKAEIDADTQTATGTTGGDIAAFPNAGTTHQWTVSAGERLGAAGQPDIPEINFHIEQQAVVSHTRKFRALWTLEAAQDLRAYHNLDLERELTDLLSKEVTLEIDRELIEDIRMIAYDNTSNDGFSRDMLDLPNANNFTGDREAQSNNAFDPGSWTYDQDAGIPGNPAGTALNVYFVNLDSFGDLTSPRHLGQLYSNLVAVCNFASQDIYKTTYRGAGNWILTSPFVAAMLASAAKLEGGLNEPAGQLGANIQYKGKWAGQYDVYVDPLYPEDEIMMGYKGASPMDSGYIYAPYIPLQMLPTITDPETFQPRKGLLTRYGKAAVTPEARFYRIIRLVGNSLVPFSKVTA